MAWRIADSVERGEIDNRQRDRVFGKLWLCGRDEPVELELTGNPWRDLAGQYLRFVNPKPKPLPEHYQNFAPEQTGVVGDMTAARKVKILDIPDGELEHYYKNKIPMPYHWGNCLYLEWHSARNGRVVIEATDYELKVEPEAAWKMNEDEEQSQHEANARAMTNFMDTLLEAAAATEAEHLADDDDAPQSLTEAEADADAARMDLLNDRIMARIEKDPNVNAEGYARIMKEERERLRQERREPKSAPRIPEEETDREEWIDAMNANFEEAMAKEDEPGELEPDPLFEQCQELGSRVREDIEDHEWLPEDAQEEHPLRELVRGILFAATKLAGALNGREDEWPPEALFAGDCLVRLKKARGYLTDALAGLDAAEADKLVEAGWISLLRQELQGIRQSVQAKINEVREVLREDEGGPGFV
jgi:hypothetical protein